MIRQVPDGCLGFVRRGLIKVSPLGALGGDLHGT
jgi:hypothetical protein